jgi:hypothetical protein
MRCKAASKNAARCPGARIPRLHQSHAHREHVSGIETGVAGFESQQVWTITPAPINNTSDSAAWLCQGSPALW